MLIAARTAPKGRGKDFLTLAIVEREGIKEISDWMKKMAKRKSVPAYFRRDAKNILSAQVMVLMGTRIESMGLDPCGMCGWGNCKEKKKHPDPINVRQKTCCCERGQEQAKAGLFESDQKFH